MGNLIFDTHVLGGIDAKIDGVITFFEAQKALEDSQNYLKDFESKSKVKNKKADACEGDEVCRFQKSKYEHAKILVEQLKEKGSMSYFKGFDLDGDNTPDVNYKLTDLSDWHRIGAILCDLNSDGIISITEVLKKIFFYDQYTPYRVEIENSDGVQHVEVYPKNSRNPDLVFTPTLEFITSYEEDRSRSDYPKLLQLAGIIEEKKGDTYTYTTTDGKTFSQFETSLKIKTEAFIQEVVPDENDTDLRKLRDLLQESGHVPIIEGFCWSIGPTVFTGFSLYNTHTGLIEKLGIETGTIDEKRCKKFKKEEAKEECLENLEEELCGFIIPIDNLINSLKEHYTSS